jgi:hypothetical protein
MIRLIIRLIIALFIIRNEPLKVEVKREMNMYGREMFTLPHPIFSWKIFLLLFFQSWADVSNLEGSKGLSQPELIWIHQPWNVNKKIAKISKKEAKMLKTDDKKNVVGTFLLW